MAEPRLRAYRPDDLDDLVAGYRDQATQRFLPLTARPFTRADGDWYLHEGVASVLERGGTLYAVADPVTDRLLGGVGLDNVVPARNQAEIGYWVGPWARRRGVATAAVRALSERAFESGTARLELLTHRDNEASQRVALAAGFRGEGVRRDALPNRDGGRDDLLAFARLAGDPPGPVERLLPDLPGGELTDGVVRLRPLAAGDAAFSAALHTLPDVVAAAVPPVAPEFDRVRRRCTGAASSWLAGTHADLVIEDAATGAPTGEITLVMGSPAGIGYRVLPRWRSRGHATRAAQLLSLWAFAETPVTCLTAAAHPDNHASRRVLQKAGFTEEAHLRSSNLIQYALLAEDLVTKGPRLDG